MELKLSWPMDYLFKKNCPMDNFATLTPHKQLVKHKNLKTVLQDSKSCTFSERFFKDLSNPLWTTPPGPRWESLLYAYHRNGHSTYSVWLKFVGTVLIDIIHSSVPSTLQCT